jgi:membrane glycosyltransferase
LFRRHWLQTVAGIAVSVVLVYVSPPLFLWMVPALAGLVFALPLSAASSSVVLAKITRALGLLTVPEELAVPRVVALRDETEARLEELLRGVTVDRLLGDELARQRHFAAVQPRPAPMRGHPDVMYITARAKLADAQTAAEALSWLTPPERLAVLGDRDLFQALQRLVDPGVSDQQALRSA